MQVKIFMEDGSFLAFWHFLADLFSAISKYSLLLQINDVILPQVSFTSWSKNKSLFFIRLHWLPIAARIKFKVLMFAYKTTTGTAPIYLNLLVQTYAPSRSLRSASERRLVVPSQRGTKSLSRTFSWTVPSWWNDLPISSL